MGLNVNTYLEGESPTVVTCGVHWLSVSLLTGHPDEVFPVVEDAFGGPLEPRGPTRFYRKAWKLGSVATVSYEHVKTGEGMLVELTGAACDCLGLSVIITLLRELMSLGGRVTRIDPYIDFERSPNLICEQARDSCNREEYCRFRKRPKIIEEAGIEPIVSTVYLGSRKSGHLVRIYDKGLERGGNPRFIVRWEAEFGNGKSHPVAEAIVNSSGDDQLRQAIIGHALGAAEFREVGEPGQSLSRREFVPWYAELLQLAQLARPKVEREKPTLESKLDWYRNQVMPYLAQVGQEFNLTPGETMDLLMGPRAIAEVQQRASGRAVESMEVALGIEAVGHSLGLLDT